MPDERPSGHTFALRGAISGGGQWKRAATALLEAAIPADGQLPGAWPARDHYAALLPLTEQALGPEHPYTLTTRANLARWTEQASSLA
jgi:hypothetical protein